MHKFETKIEQLKFDFAKYYIFILILRQLFLTIVNLIFKNYFYTYIDGISIAIISTVCFFHLKNPFNFEKIGKESCYFLLVLHFIYGAFSQNLVSYVVYNTFLFAIGFYIFFNYKKTVLLTISTLFIYPLNTFVSFTWPNKITNYDYINSLEIISIGFAVFLLLILLYYSTEIKKHETILEFIENKEKILSDSNLKKQILPNHNDFYSTLFKKIEDYMKSKEPWRNAEYNLEQLAKDINFNVFQISTAINYCKKNNFKTYLNDFRLNAFEEQIKKIDNEENLSLKEIYLDIGFNSRVTFNRTFKNKFKKTPQEYISDINCEQKVD